MKIKQVWVATSRQPTSIRGALARRPGGTKADEVRRATEWIRFAPYASRTS
jgi:hypothetical protein